MTDCFITPSIKQQVVALVDYHLKSERQMQCRPTREHEIAVFVPADTESKKISEAQNELEEALLLNFSHLKMKVRVINGQSYLATTGKSRSYIQACIKLGFIIPISLLEEKPKILKSVIN